MSGGKSGKVIACLSIGKHELPRCINDYENIQAKINESKVCRERDERQAPDRQGTHFTSGLIRTCKSGRNSGGSKPTVIRVFSGGSSVEDSTSTFTGFHSERALAIVNFPNSCVGLRADGAEFRASIRLRSAELVSSLSSLGPVRVAVVALENVDGG